MVNGRKSAALISWVNCMCAEKTESLSDLKDLSIYLYIIQTIKASVDVKPLLKRSESEKGNYIRGFLHQFFQKNACLQTVNWDGLTVGEQAELELAKLTVAFLCCAVVSTEIQSRMKFLDPDTQIQLHEILKFVMDNEESSQLQFDLELLLNVGCVVRSPGVVTAASGQSSVHFSSPMSSLPPSHGPGVRFRDLQIIASSSSMNNLPSSPGSPSSPMLSFFEQPAVEVHRLKQQLRQEWEQREELEGELSNMSHLLQQSEQEVAELRGRVERLVQLTETRAPSPLPFELAELHEKTQRLSLTLKQYQELKKENELMERRLTQLGEENSELFCKVRESCTQLTECRALLDESGRSAAQRHAEAEGRIHRLEKALGEALNSKASLEEMVRILQGKLAAHAEKEAALKEQYNQPPGEVMSDILQMEKWHMCQKAQAGWMHTPDRQLSPLSQAHTDAMHLHNKPTSSWEDQPSNHHNTSNQENAMVIVRDRKDLMTNESTVVLEGSVVDQDSVTLREELDGHESKRTNISQDISAETTQAQCCPLKQNIFEGSTLSHREKGIMMDMQENFKFRNGGDRDILERDRILLQQERMALNKEIDIFEHEKAALEKERMSLIAMKEEYRSTLMDHMFTTQASMEKERAILGQEQNKLNLERNALKAMQDEIQFNAGQEKSSLDLAKSKLEQDMIILNKKWKCFEQERDILLKEREVQKQDKANLTKEIISLKASVEEDRLNMRAGLEKEWVLLENERKKILERVTAQQKDNTLLQQESITMQQEVNVLEQVRVALACIITSLDKIETLSGNEKANRSSVLEQGMATLKAILKLDGGITCKKTYTDTPDNAIQERERIDLVASLEQETVTLKRELTTLHQERAEWSTEKTRLVQEQTVLEQQWAVLHQEKESLDQEMANLKVKSEQERATRSEMVSKLQQENSCLHTDKKRLKHDMAKLRATVDEEEMRLTRQRVQLDKEIADNDQVRSNLNREMSAIKKQKNLLDQIMTTFESEKADFLQLKATVENKNNFTALSESDCVMLKEGQIGSKQVKELVVSESATEKQECDVYKAKQERDALKQRQGANTMSSDIKHSIVLEPQTYKAMVAKTQQSATQHRGMESTAALEKGDSALKVCHYLLIDPEIQEMSSPEATTGCKTDRSEIKIECTNSYVDQGKIYPEVERGSRELRKEILGENKEMLTVAMEENVDAAMHSKIAINKTPANISERDMAPNDFIITKEEFSGATLQDNVSEHENNFDTDMKPLKISSKENLEQTPSEVGRRHSMITRSAQKRSSGHSQNTLYFTPLQARSSLVDHTPALDWSFDSLGDLVIDSAKKKPRTSSAQRRTTHIIDITLNKKVESCRRESISSVSSVSTTHATTAYMLRSCGDAATPLKRYDWSLGFPGSSASFVTLGTFASQNSLQIEDLRCGRLSDASLRSLPGYRPPLPHRADGHHLELSQAPPSTRCRKGNASYYMSCVDEPEPEAEWDELQRQGLVAHAAPPREPRTELKISTCCTDVSQQNQPRVNCKVDFSEKSDAKNNHLLRKDELRGRNQAAPPHLRSCYPPEVETFIPGQDLNMAKPEMTARRMSLRPVIANTNADMRKRKSLLGHSGEGSPESKKSGAVCFAVPATPREKQPAPQASSRRYDPPQSSWPIIRRLRRSMSRKKSPNSKASKP